MGLGADDLAQAGGPRIGTRVWLPAPKDKATHDVFMPGKLIEPGSSKALVQYDAGGEPVEVKSDAIMPANPTSTAAEDVCLLLRLNEATVLSNVIERFAVGDVYTWVGTILISMNPFEQRPALYDEATQRRFSALNPATAPPHIFAIAEVAHRGAMRSRGVSQSIVVSGESGAGKTYANRLMLGYLSFRSGGDASGEALARAMSDCNPVLEAFGNAKTTRNDNSSRFGRFQQVQLLAPVGRISTVRVSTYLLESSRVTSISDPERNCALARDSRGSLSTSRHGSPLLSRHGSPLLSRHGSPLLSRHGSPLLSNHRSVICGALPYPPT